MEWNGVSFWKDKDQHPVEVTSDASVRALGLPGMELRKVVPS